MIKPTISVVIHVYNVVDNIIRSLDSILNQIYKSYEN